MCFHWIIKICSSTSNSYVYSSLYCPKDNSSIYKLSEKENNKLPKVTCRRLMQYCDGLQMFFILCHMQGYILNGHAVVCVITQKVQLDWTS